MLILLELLGIINIIYILFPLLIINKTVGKTTLASTLATPVKKRVKKTRKIRAKASVLGFLEILTFIKLPVYYTVKDISFKL